MRTDFVSVRASESLRDAAVTLRKAMKDQPNRACAVALSDEGEFMGVVTAWWALLYMGKSALKESLKPKEGREFEDKFKVACRKRFSERVGDALEKDVPVVKPQDPLVVVLLAMLESRRRWAVVMEGGKVLGVIAAEDLFMQMEWDELEG
jgi:CBS domain-containing protein